MTPDGKPGVAEWLRHYGWGNFLGVLRCRLLKGCHPTRWWNREAAPIHPAVMAQPSRYGWVTLSRWNKIRRTSRLTATADRAGPALPGIHSPKTAGLRPPGAAVLSADRLMTPDGKPGVAEWLRHYGWGNFLGALRCRLLKGCHLTRCWNREAAPHPPSRDGAAIPLRMGDALTVERNPQDIPPYRHGGPRPIRPCRGFIPLKR
jgi:hypothetical protein